MIDVSEAMRHVGRPDDGRGYAPPYGGLKYGAHGPFYPPQMMYPPHMPMIPGQGPGVPMMFPHPMQFAGYSPMYGSIPYGVAPPTEVEKEAETAAAETPTTSFIRTFAVHAILYHEKKYTIRNENYNTPRAATDRLDAL
jgi:hypothetical protein